VDLDQVTV
jgi:glucan phosphoethanolaminetransferase (alkaline phosphatase superfamily)